MIIAGVNGGGTKTEAVCCDEKGRIIGGATSGPSNYHNTGMDASVANVGIALASAGAVNPDCVCIALAAINTENDKKLLSKRFSEVYQNSIVEHDAFAELYTERRGKPGVLAIAGTGSIAFGYDGKKRYRRCNNGWFLGDDGSGYAVGRQGIRTVSKMLIEDLERTSIADEVLKHLNLKNAEELMEWSYSNSNTPLNVAGTSRAVDRAASMGDKNAEAIIKAASTTLADYSCELAEKINEDTVFINGGMFNSGIYRSNFAGKLKERGLKCTRISKSAAIGALLIAADSKGIKVKI